jgi:hypothetical protein
MTTEEFKKFKNDEIEKGEIIFDIKDLEKAFEAGKECGIYQPCSKTLSFWTVSRLFGQTYAVYRNQSATALELGRILKRGGSNPHHDYR